jgi:two-component system sensor histidine kinase YesM
LAGRRFRNWISRIIERSDMLSIQKKLVISYVFIILLPIIGLSIYVFNEFYEQTLKEIKQNNAYLLEIEKNNVENNMELMERSAQLIDPDSNDEISDYLNGDEDVKTEDLITFHNNVYTYLLKLQFNNPSIGNIRIFAENEYVSEIWPVFLHERRINGEPWYSDLMSRKETLFWHIQREDKDVLQRYSQNITPSPKISLFRKIHYKLGHRHAGVSEVDMLLENFFTKTFSELHDSQSQMIVIDRSGEMYWKTSDPFLSNSGLSNTLLYERFNEIQAKAKGDFEFVHNEVPYLVNYIAIEPLEVFMLNVVSLEETLSGIHRMRNTIIAAALILIIVLSLASYQLHAYILKSFRILSDSMKKVRYGNFNIDIPIQGHGEIGELAHHFRKLIRKINSLIADAVNKQASAKEAELRTLKNQIDAHFLYNTLENIKMLAEIEGQYQISDSLTSLGNMMRYNLRWSGDFVRVRDEVEHIHNYVALMNMRYDNQLRLIVEIEPEVMEQELLKMTMQPIVENAVKHGMRIGHQAEIGLTIHIEARAQGELTTITITDDGVGMTADKVEELNSKARAGVEEGTGIGLINVNDRIRLHHGQEYGLTVISEKDEYTRVTVIIPTLLLAGGASNHA